MQYSDALGFRVRVESREQRSDAMVGWATADEIQTTSASNSDPARNERVAW
ncbi:MAG: hypothetical protein H7Z74_10700 [Anaerolineae bacterium]|nr:hypothetical protein [Gemmatimonadaceae bacterium]